MQLRCLILILSAYQVAASKSLSNLTRGFLNSTVSIAYGNSTVCVSGLIPLPVTATNINLTVSQPANQTEATQLLQELFQVNSTIIASSIGGNIAIQDTYDIDATICVPNVVGTQSVTSIQVLTHGTGLDKTYWDIAPGYSYVDAAANAGYATLAYNRLGVGNSSHPDPFQVVQCGVDLEVLHELVELLRAGKVGPGNIKNVIGVGHSYGSIVQLSQTAKYPSDVDAAVLTGFTTQVANLQYTALANNPAIANQNDPARFGGLPNGYLVDDTSISVQLPFFRYPFFDQAIFDDQLAAKNTYAFGQSFTLAAIYGPAPNFTGPVDIVAGQYDFPFCFGDCTYPTNQVAATIPALYPAARNSSQSYLVPDCGHYINAHYGAPMEFAQINNFLGSNGF